jgi:hypothetical protein
LKILKKIINHQDITFKEIDGIFKIPTPMTVAIKQDNQMSIIFAILFKNITNFVPVNGFTLQVRHFSLLKPVVWFSTYLK